MHCRGSESMILMLGSQYRSLNTASLPSFHGCFPKMLLAPFHKYYYSYKKVSVEVIVTIITKLAY